MQHQQELNSLILDDKALNEMAKIEDQEYAIMVEEHHKKTIEKFVKIKTDMRTASGHTYKLSQEFSEKLIEQKMSNNKNLEGPYKYNDESTYEGCYYEDERSGYGVCVSRCIEAYSLGVQGRK